MYDLCIIGGGAAGISCAITAGRLGLKVLLIEKNNKLGKKLYATGNGKCNLTNDYMDLKMHYNSADKNYFHIIGKIYDDAFSKATPNVQIKEFVASLGLNTISNNNYIYPQSAQASSVVWAMVDELNHLNVDIRLKTEIIDITYKGSYFEIKSQNDAFKAVQTVLANGGASYAALGGSLSGYKLCEKLGHTINPIRPCLCGLKVKEDLTDIAGVRANSKISLYLNNKIISESKGELQFTKEGLSGICIFEISSNAGSILQEKEHPQIVVNLLDNDDTDTTYNKFIEQISSEAHNHRTIQGFLNGFINDKLAYYACKLNKIDPKAKLVEIPGKLLLQLADTLKAMSFNINDLYDYDMAQLTAGGVSISEINSNTLESKIVNDLYITGELLDIDGICGGYNLTFAILSGIKAGKSAYVKNQSN